MREVDSEKIEGRLEKRAKNDEGKRGNCIEGIFVCFLLRVWDKFCSRQGTDTHWADCIIKRVFVRRGPKPG
jgi:hypothetical protein